MRALALAAALLALALPAAAHPDLTGYWMLSRKQPPPDAAMMAKLPADAVLLHDTGPTELPAGDYGGLKLTPEALAAAKAWTPKDDMALSKVCAPPSIIYAMQGPFPLRIEQGTQFVLIRLEYFDMVRIVFMDGRKHLPADAPHSKIGDSIGHWEGDELVVDTDHLEASTITNNGLGHSDEVHVVERFRLSADGERLSATQLFADPKMLENKGARFIAWDKQAGEYLYPYECDPTFGLNYGAPAK